MFRSFFLFLSTSQRTRRILTGLPFAMRFASRFIAGETLDSAIQAIRKINAKGMLVTLDHLGENVSTEADAIRATEDCLHMYDKIAEAGVKANVSVKLTQLGLDIGDAVCLNNMRRIMQKAQQHNNFLRIDMEGAPYLERTLQIFRTLHEEYGFKNVGIVIQSYLYRSEQDMRELAAEGVNVRLVKGAYKEPSEIAFPQKADVDKNFIKLVQLYLSHEARSKGAYIAVATHDENMINATKEFAAAQGIGKDQFEFQMLYGVRSQAQEQLAAEGYRMRLYVPYGTQWYPYFMRRLAERPANVWFLLRNLIRG